ncbi:expressed unknown protein [Seminavis robusta]|uniref:Uncharacterized protein n=1 Tax=Seminavis robusta TaxID=568900 RepID=A0A9N8DFK1_9STRA|nr:expressed unknown protein [Seminavis robusta]|eukprot:Sro45_g026910.1 n/a (96) ;mRNA; f:69921-70208
MVKPTNTHSQPNTTIGNAFAMLPEEQANDTSIPDIFGFSRRRTTADGRPLPPQAILSMILQEALDIVEELEEEMDCSNAADSSCGQPDEQQGKLR